MDSIYEYTAPIFIKTLGGLKTVLQKAREHGVDENILLADRLAPDMFPFKKQVQVACDNAKGAIARLAAAEIPKFDDNENSLEDLQKRIDKTIEWIGTVDPGAFEDAASRKITLPYYKDKWMSGYDYAREYALPNFFFHVVTAYALVRKNDVNIGKSDYINGLPLQDL